jgi:hypothetical protein
LTVDQIVDLFLTTHKVKTEQVVKRRVKHCVDIELTVYLSNETGPVSLVLDLHLDHERWDSSTDPKMTTYITLLIRIGHSMRRLMTRSESIELTVTITTIYHL